MREVALQDTHKLRQDMTESLRAMEQEVNQRLRESRELQTKMHTQLEEEKARMFKYGTDRSEEISVQQ